MQSESALDHQLRPKLSHLTEPIRINAMPSKQLFCPRTRSYPSRFELSNDLSAPNDGEALAAMLDRVEQVSEAAGRLGCGDLGHILRLSDARTRRKPPAVRAAVTCLGEAVDVFELDRADARAEFSEHAAAAEGLQLARISNELPTPRRWRRARLEASPCAASAPHRLDLAHR